MDGVSRVGAPAESDWSVCCCSPRSLFHLLFSLSPPRALSLSLSISLSLFLCLPALDVPYIALLTWHPEHPGDVIYSGRKMYFDIRRLRQGASYEGKYQNKKVEGFSTT